MSGPAPASPPAAVPRARGGALAVATGIFFSRIAGLVRERAIAHYLGISPEAGAFRAALRIPNLLQNLLGEGVLSASFIPVYVGLRAAGKDAEATRVARAVGTLLALVAAAIAVAGILFASSLVEVLAPGFAGDTRELTVSLVRILFPGTALLVVSAWCLGVLNSHDKFLLPYVSPVLWNIAQITAVIVAGRHFAGHDDDDVVRWLAYGTVIGSAAQLVAQLPSVIALLKTLRPSLAVRDPGVQRTLRAFVPVLLGRGSVQLSSYVDQVIASYLGDTIVAAIANAQTLALLPVSLFGMAVSAAELPAMSSATGSIDERAAALRDRLRPALRRVAYLVVPSAVALVAIGAPIVALLFQSGRFGSADVREVWIILAGSALGLSAGTQGQVLKSAFYALHDTKSPLYAALARVAITGSTGWVVALPLRAALGYDAVWGAFGLTASAGFAAWVEFWLLRRWLAAKIGEVPVPARFGLAMLGAAAVAGVAGWGAAWVASAVGAGQILQAVPAIGVFGAVYVGITVAAKVPEARGFVRRLPGAGRLVR